MALTEEEILQQINVLTKKTSENPEMVYKTSATRNTALDPEYFSGQDTKIVNAINKLAADFKTLEKFVKSSSGKNDDILMDIHTDINAPIWEETKELMESSTIIEGINLILKGHHLHKILNITVDDIDKVLTVAQDEKGKLITKAVPIGELGHTADTVKYENEALPEVHTVEDAINFILTNGAGSSPGNFIVDWDTIQNKPEVPNNLVLSEGSLDMKSGDEVLSSIDITVDSDIEEIINNLK